MLTLLTYPSAFGLFSASPFCVKAAYLLHLSGRKWQRADLLDARKMPHRKLPVLRTPRRLIADSDGIRHWLEAEGAQFDNGLTDLQKGQSQALIRLAEDHLYFQLLYDRWGNDRVWPELRDMFFAQVPWPIRKLVAGSVRKSVLDGLNAQGVSRFSDSERYDRIERDLQAITTYLWHSPFLMGEHPTSADLSVAPVLSAMRATPIGTRLTRRIAGDPVLSDYLDRMDHAIVLP